MKKMIWILTVIFLLFVSCQPMLDFSDANNATVHILAVGLDYRNVYEEDDTLFGESGILKGTVYDVCELAYCLNDIYEEIGLKHDTKYMVAYGLSASEKFTDNYPSADNILRAIRDTKVKPNDLLILLYAGHADAPYDDEPFFCAGKVNDEEPYSTLYMKDVYAELGKKSCSCLVILDTCYSGSMLNWDQTQQYMDQAVTKFLEQDDFSNISILASSQAYETSHYELEKYKASSQEHGYFTLGLLDTLGWVHDLDSDKVRFQSFGQSGVAIRGHVETVPKSMTVQDMYNGVLERWEGLTINASSGARYQEPTRSFTHSVFVPVPYGGMEVPIARDTYQSGVVAIVNGKPYTDIQRAVDAVAIDGEPNPIYIIGPVKSPPMVEVRTGSHTPIVINFGPDTFMPYLRCTGGGEVYIHGKTEKEVNVLDPDSTKVYFDDVQRTKNYTSFGITIILPSLDDLHK